MIPVTIISGFLGSGKTTLINDLIHEFPKERFAIVTNEFGDSNLESKFLKNPLDQIIEFPSGCLCHAPKGDIAKALKLLLKRQPNTTYILIEPSGLSDPFAVSAALNEKELKDIIQLDSIVCTLDCANYPNKDFKKEQSRQLDCADILVATKTDLASIPNLKTKAKILSKNPENLKLLLNTQTFSKTRHSESDSESTHSSHQTFIYKTEKTFDRYSLEKLLSSLPTEVIRAKGIVNLDNSFSSSFLLQYVGQRFTLTKTKHEPISTILFIGSQFEEFALQQRLEISLQKYNPTIGEKILRKLKSSINW